MTVFAAILHGSETVRKAGTAVKSADKVNRRYTEESCVSGFCEATRSFHVCRSDGTFGRAIARRDSSCYDLSKESRSFGKLLEDEKKA